jgi:hypothetical protein
VPTVGKFTSIGCYSDGVNGTRTLGDSEGYYDAIGMTVEGCAASCKSYSFFGVEYGQECYCGTAIGGQSASVGASSCSEPCKGSPAESYGVSGFMNLYQAL